MTGPRPWREVAAGYDAGAAGYDQRHGARRDRVRTARLERPLLDAMRGAERVLEVGVGTGRLLAQVRAPTRVGVDISAGMLAQAAGRGLAVARADAHRLPFAAAAFDAVLAGGGVLRYLDTDRALDELRRVVRPGGVVAIHQFGARTWSLRRGARTPDPRVHELDDVDDLLRPAARRGFAAERVVRWRPLPAPPYVVEIPAWLDRLSPRQLWGHVVIVLRRLPA